MKPRPHPLPLIRLTLAGLAACAAPGCVNSPVSDLSTSPSPAALASPSPSGSVDNFVIANVVVALASGSTSTSVPTVTIYFNPSTSTSANGVATPPQITNHCQLGSSGSTSAEPCVCQFTWSETNASTGTSYTYTRTVQTPVTNVQQELVTCSAPPVYPTQIAAGTSVSYTLIPGQGNTSTFTASTFSQPKSASATAGSFQDAEGNSYDNIVHYSCYEQFQMGTVIQSMIGTKTNSQTGQQVSFPFANQFCMQTSNSSGGTPSCPSLPATSAYSAQAYYYNFFIRDTDAGNVNQWNDNYTCPTVKEPIYNGGTVGAEGNLYPMDSNFALSMGSSATFNVGVNSFLELADGGKDPVSASAQLCDGSTYSGNATTSGFVEACLGYAATPNANGTCPSIRTSSGGSIFTYRLRRFVALYPPVFGVTGSAPTTPQAMDTIYVLDRPVTPPAGANPLVPYTMRGPKPCPFSLFDSKGVTGVTDTAYTEANNGLLPVYAATNNPAWNGTNVDGIQFPNADSSNATTGQSCSTLLPLVQANTTSGVTTVTAGTVNVKNPVLKRVYVRPITAWAPHYEEDLSFQACAPQALPMHDPPMHFSKDFTTGNVSWCAEVYPSQNDHVPELDPLANPSAPLSSTNTYIGHVRPFTSHVAKNSASATCNATIPATIPANTSAGLPLYPLADPLPSGTATCASTNADVAVARHPWDAFVDNRNYYPSVAAQPTAEPICAPNTCDRTAIISGGPGWQQFPLLATAPQVEQAIASDTTYGCVVTFDNNGPKSGKLTPTQGCCGPNVQLYTGLLPTGNQPSSPELLNQSAHLEPDVPCLTPQY